MVNHPGNQTASEIRNEIVSGANERKTISMQYRDKNNNVSERIVEPYEFKNGDFWAFCQDRNGIRKFKPENISAAQKTDTFYEPRFPVKIHPEARDYN